MSHVTRLGFLLVVCPAAPALAGSWRKSGGAIAPHYRESDVDIVQYNWWYNWNMHPDPFGRLKNVSINSAEFVPMIWGREQVARLKAGHDTLPSARAILGFNEPNMHVQADMTPLDACKLWPDLEAAAEKLSATTLVSPAVNHCWNLHHGRCEVWTRPKGIDSSVERHGFICLRREQGTANLSNGTRVKLELWDPVHGGVGRACRGSYPKDNKAEYYTVHRQVGHDPKVLLEDCKAKCERTAGCHGIEHASHWNGCNMSPADWLSGFFAQCPHARVDAIALHIYGCNAHYTEEFVKNISSKFQRPVWLTEFACQGQSKKRTFEYMQEVLPLLEALPSSTLARYAWFIQRTRPHAWYANVSLVASAHGDRSMRTDLGDFYSVKHPTASENFSYISMKVATDVNEPTQYERYQGPAVYPVVLASLTILVMAVSLTMAWLLIERKRRRAYFFVTDSPSSGCPDDSRTVLRATP